MDAHRYWSEFFARWPSRMARKGVVVTNFGEQMSFSEFMAGPDLLMVERQTPDTMGARKVVIPYASVAAVKITEIVKAEMFKDLGFSPPAVAP